ncbi:hypothetical protein [Methanoculleus sp.]|uniref:hypothetical protein n=1 Tax=Methanoculleus sp. TaxID=90427 RepID=UPI0034509D33
MTGEADNSGPRKHRDVYTNGKITLKLQIRVIIAMITLIAILASAGCIEPASPAVNTTQEPTQEPCETCTVPEDFCGPPGVCPGEPVNSVYAFTDRNVYRIGEVIEFGIVNCGDEPVEFGSPRPWWIERWITNVSEGTPGNDTSDTWEIIGGPNYVPTMEWPLHPGETEIVRWNTTDWNTPEWYATMWNRNITTWNSTEIRVKLERWRVHPVDDSVTLAPGTYRIRYGRNFTKKFEFA